jgi:membrane associated rhomboid family serine protease
MSNFIRKPISMINIIIGINIIFFIPWIIELVTPIPIHDIFVKVFALNVDIADTNFNVNTGAYWQIITAMFMHGDIVHIFFNMYALFIFGLPLEYRWGKSKFLAFYLTTGILANIASIFFLLMMNSMNRSDVHVPLLGASGAIMAVLLGFGCYYPDAKLLLFFIIPLKVKWLILLYAGAELFFQFQKNIFPGIAHFTHLFGLLFGFLYLLIFFKVNAVKEMFFPNRNNFTGYS